MTSPSTRTSRSRLAVAGATIAAALALAAPARANTDATGASTDASPVATDTSPDTVATGTGPDTVATTPPPRALTLTAPGNPPPSATAGTAGTATAKPAPFRVGLVLGLFTPVGSLGLDFQYDLAPHLSLSGGFGAAFSGPQVAIMPRLHTGNGPARFYIGGGISGGPYTPVHICWSDCEPEPDGVLAIWGNVEAGIEVASDTVFLRAFSGLSTIVNDHPARNDDDDNPLPYGGITFGRHF